ncbi:MAG: glycoside hydrolase [Lentisphaerae bacterium]|nr:glycoside hydrolase [Lentisphaerota bacterium]
MKHYVAIDNVCAWPNLTQRPNGEILATIFNQPCHGKWEGDVECWASTDGGVFWKRRGVPAPHEPKTNRMNVAAGQAANGDLVVLASGWSDKSVRDKAKAAPFRSEVLPTWICRSKDGGATWALDGELPPGLWMTETITKPRLSTWRAAAGWQPHAPQTTPVLIFLYLMIMAEVGSSISP